MTGQVDLWREGYEVGRAAERRTLQGRAAAARMAAAVEDLKRTIGLLARLLERGPVESKLTPDLAAIAEAFMPCTCLPDYTRRGRVDPMCRHDDRDDLVEAVLEHQAHAERPAAQERWQLVWADRGPGDGEPWPRCLPPCEQAGVWGATGRMPEGHVWQWRNEAHTSGYLAHVIEPSAATQAYGATGCT